MSNRLYSSRRRNPGWLSRIFRAIGDWRKRRAAYQHYMATLKCTPAEARDLADRTILR